MVFCERVLAGAGAVEVLAPPGSAPIYCTVIDWPDDGGESVPELDGVEASAERGERDSREKRGRREAASCDPYPLVWLERQGATTCGAIQTP